MILSCIQGQCSEHPKYYCKCNNFQTFLCTSHAFQHLDENGGPEHSIQSMYKTIPSEKKNFVIEQCSIVSECIKEIEISLSTSFQEAINILNEQKTALIKYFREKKDSLQYIIDKITNETKEIIVPGFEIHGPYQINCLGFLNQLTDHIAYDTRNFTKKIQDYSKEILEKKEIFGEFLDFTGNANLDENLYGFKAEQKLL